MRRVTIIPAGVGNGQEIVIFDETKSPYPDACADGFVPQLTRLIRPTPEIRAPWQPVFDRYNPIVRWSFTVTHTFATVDECQDFVGERPDVLPGAGELSIQLVTPETTSLRFYKTAFIESHGPARDEGCTVRYRYSLILNSSYSEKP